MNSKKQRLIRRNEVEDRVGLKRSAIYDRMQRGEFPRPVKLSETAVAWRESDIDRWIEEQIQASGLD